MKKMKKALAVLITVLLIFSSGMVGVWAYIEGPELVDITITLEVGKEVNGVYTALTPGERLYQGDVITVRIAPVTNFLTGNNRHVVMYNRSLFRIVGDMQTAFSYNHDHPFAEVIANVYGTALPDGIPEQGWPPAFKSVEQGGDGTYTQYSAAAVNNTSNLYSPNGGFPRHITGGDWLFSFKLEVLEDLTPDSGARIWMDGSWIRTPSYTNANAYFVKCLDSEKSTTQGSSIKYYWNLDLTGADLDLDPYPDVDITFDANGGEGGTGPTTMTPGAALTPPDVTRAGHSFVGWQPSVPPYVPAEDTTYYAQWNINQYTVSFNSAGGSAVGSITEDYNTAITPPAPPVKPGYAFTGWLPDVPVTMPDHNVECVAQWEQLPARTIYFDLNGGDSEPVAPMVLYAGAEVMPPADPARQNYTFAGWLPNVPSIMPDEDVYCVAKWTLNKYAITWDPNGGDGGGVNECEHGSMPTPINAGIRTGYTFDGWSPEIAAATGTATYTAQWKANTYDITWDANGGNGGGTNQCDHDQMPTPISAGTREGYDFVGWSPEVTAATGSATYTAQWQGKEVSITFDANGGTGGTGPTVMRVGDPLTAPAVAKEGYVLGGWEPEVPATAPVADTTYVAQWVQTLVTLNKTGEGMDVNIYGWESDSKYQIWTYQQVTSDDVLSADTDVKADQWILSMPYAAGSEGAVQGDGSILFKIDDFVSSTPNYTVAVRIADSNGDFVAELRDSYTPEEVGEAVLTKIVIDGKVTTGYEIKKIEDGTVAIEIVGNDVPNLTYSAQILSGVSPAPMVVGEAGNANWDISGLEPGIYVVEFKVTGDNEDVMEVTFELYSENSATAFGVLSSMSADYANGTVSVTPSFSNGTFSFLFREPSRTAEYGSIEYSSPGTFTYATDKPGVYHVLGLVTRAGRIGTEADGFDDGIIRTVVIPRVGTPGGPVTMTLSANETLPYVQKGTPLVFTAETEGLPGPVEYSFWRYDATGYILIQDWSTANTLNWTPARIGDYYIEARAKGVGAGSYEIKRSVDVYVFNAGESKADVTGITLNVAEVEANAQAKKPVVLKAKAVSANEDKMLYKFYVYDEDMRLLEIRDYTPNPTCVWTPRKAGLTYTISVLIKSSDSFGKYDAIETFDISV